MTNDFHDLYNKLSTAELLQILAEKDNYRPEAIAAATEILQARDITADDRQSLEIFQGAKAEEVRKRETRRLQLNEFWDAVRPDKKKSLRQKFLLLFAFLVTACLFRMYSEFRPLITYLLKGVHRIPGYFYGQAIGSLFDLALSVSMLYLYFRRYKAGWTLGAVLS
ncbi:MAG: hypothetical protein JST39_17210, partial [Bacteroidetes bacterium]|nr:hypothetical protein [Bacteroidota bacterium]